MSGHKIHPHRIYFKSSTLPHESSVCRSASEKFIGELETQGITISMDGRGRCFDNIFMERLWRSLKYEEIYLRDYQLVPEARAGIGNWFRFYNQQRPHQSLGYRTPAELYLG